MRFTHPTLLEGARSSVSPVLAAPLLAPGWFLTPKVGVRSVSYCAGALQPGEPQSPQVSIPWASLDSGLVFERDSGLFGPGSTQTLEPRLFYVYVPYRNQDAIPIFDTALADFNYAQLFTENRFVGGDRFGDANQVTLALTSRFLRSDGQEALRATHRAALLLRRRARRPDAHFAAALHHRFRHPRFDRRAHRPGLELRCHHAVQPPRAARASGTRSPAATRPSPARC